MKKFRVGLVILLAVTLLVGLQFNSLVAQETEEIPEIFQLNPSLDFDKEAIKQWAEEHSWEEAFNLAQDAHSRFYAEDDFNQSGEGGFVTFYTPVIIWVDQNFSGEQRSWSEEEIKEKYRSYLRKPTESAYFLVSRVMDNRAGLEKENLRFVLEVGDKTWEASSVSARELEERQFSGNTAYRRFFHVQFDFTDMEGHPKWSKWTLYIIREDVKGKQEFVWDFASDEFIPIKDEVWDQIPKNQRFHMTVKDSSGSRKLAIAGSRGVKNTLETIFEDSETVSFLLASFNNKDALIVYVYPFGSQDYHPSNFSFTQNNSQYDDLDTDEDMMALGEMFTGGELTSATVGVLALPEAIDLSQPFKIWYGNYSTTIDFSS